MKILKTGYIVDKGNMNYKEIVACDGLQVYYYPYNEETEKLIITNLSPNEFLCPKWDGEKWIETATEEELKKIQE